MSTTINNDESPEELVDKVIDQDSLKDKVGVFMMIMINFCNRKKMSPEWIESLIFRVTERTSETIIQVRHPRKKHEIENYRNMGVVFSNLELQAREFLFLLQKKDRELYRHIFSIYEKKRKKEDTRSTIIVVVIVIVVIIILFSF